MRLLRHVLVVGTALALLIGLPLIRSGALSRLRGGKTDAVSGASEAIDKPSGEYIVIINTELHSDPAAFSAWREFFENGDSDGLYSVFEDISCTVASNDPAGLEMARSFMSRLPENQMTVRTEDPTLMLSKAEDGRFDVIVMSSEMADVFGADRVAERTSAEILTVREEQGDEEA